MKKLFLLAFLLALASCGQPEARKPVEVKSGSFYKASVERSKKLLAEEKKIIEQLIANDSLNEYYSSTDGFWYVYETKVQTKSDVPKTNDEVLLAYTVMTLGGDTIYKQEDIGIVQHAIDKSQLFPGLRNGIKLLKEGEKATFLFPSSQAYGYRGDDKKIPPSMAIKSSVQLLEILNKKDSLN